MNRRMPFLFAADHGFRRAGTCPRRPSSGEIPKLEVAVALALLVFALVLPACHQASPPPADPVEATTVEATTVEAATDGAVKDAKPTVAPLPKSEVDARRWLIVQRVRDGEPGAWATGTFHPQRNKIEIKTHGAKAFSIDTGRILINWDRLVILSIDGVSSELRKRDFQVYPFVRDSHGRWVVVE